MIPITSLASNEETNGSLIVAGAADGSIRLFDRRQTNKHALIAVMPEHKGWIINACLPTMLNQQVQTSFFLSLLFQLISGASTGDVKIWDLRNTRASLKTIIAHPTSNMSGFCVHHFAPVFAVGSQDQKIRVRRQLPFTISNSFTRL